MKPTARLHELGQSLWLDNITRTMLGDGTLKGYIDELSVTGLTSNPTIFDKAISGGDAYDEQIAEVSAAAEAGEGVGANADERVFFELALADLRDATDLFAAVHERTDGVDGFCSLEVSPLLADDAGGDDRAGGRAPRQGRARQPLHQDPGHRGRPRRRSRSRSSPASRSTSPCSSTTSSTSAPPRPTCAGSSGGSRPGSTPTSPRSPRSSSAAGTSPSPTRSRTSCTTGSGSRSAAAPTAPTASCSTPTAGSG